MALDDSEWLAGKQEIMDRLLSTPEARRRINAWSTTLGHSPTEPPLTTIRYNPPATGLTGLTGFHAQAQGCSTTTGLVRTLPSIRLPSVPSPAPKAAASKYFDENGLLKFSRVRGVFGLRARPAEGPYAFRYTDTKLREAIPDNVAGVVGVLHRHLAQ